MPRGTGSSRSARGWRVRVRACCGRTAIRALGTRLGQPLAGDERQHGLAHHRAIGLQARPERIATTPCSTSIPIPSRSCSRAPRLRIRASAAGSGSRRRPRARANQRHRRHRLAGEPDRRRVDEESPGRHRRRPPTARTTPRSARDQLGELRPRPRSRLTTVIAPHRPEQIRQRSLAPRRPHRAAPATRPRVDHRPQRRDESLAVGVLADPAPVASTTQLTAPINEPTPRARPTTRSR